MDVKMWMLSFKDLALQKQIGEGSFGRVSKEEWHGRPGCNFGAL